MCMDLLTELTAHPSSPIFCRLIRNVAWVLRWRIFLSGSLELLSRVNLARLFILDYRLFFIDFILNVLCKDSVEVLIMIVYLEIY